MVSYNNKEDLNNDQGFIRKPYARKKIIRAPDGSTHVVYEDIRTGKIVNPQGYTVIQSDNGLDNTHVTETQGESLGKNQTQQNGGQEDKTITQDILQSHDASHVATDTAKTDAGSSYYNKPGWMGFTNFLPGTLGTLSMLGNLGININNTEAVNKQKEALGFTPSTGWQNVKSAVNDQHGYIGDVTTTRTDGSVNTAPVSFEATDANNRTTYTPEEARMRELMAGAVPATDAQKQTAIGTFNGEFPDQQSFYSKLTSSAKGLFSGMFGNPKPATGSGSVTAPAPGSGVTVDSHGFPSAPSAPNSGFGITNSADNSPDDRDNNNNNSGSNGGYSSPGLF